MSDLRDSEGNTDGAQEDRSDVTNQDNPTISILHLKGQMMYMNEWDSIMFLGTPIMSSLDDMFKIGLYINDLSMHDSSRDLVLAGTQQSAELKLALDQEQEKSRLLEQSMIKLDQEMQRTDALLYQMIPKPVADRLRKGVPSVETCQVFENVTILFSDVVGFTTICSQITPMEVVSMLNAMYTQFDQLSERHSVYKVETIGDAYMAVSGAPTVTKYHALHMCDMALDMRASTNTLLNPSNNETMKIRIGVHTGTTVAGVVGIKMPRYCLFGDTVNTASRMETSGEAMKIHISQTTRAELKSYPYEVQERGSIEVKGKGKMKTYWLIAKDHIPVEDLPNYPFIGIMEEEVRNRNRDEQIENNNSRLNMDSGQPLCDSPIPYSPVSYKDLFEDRISLIGRKFSRGSRGSGDGEALRLGATMTPRGSRASLPGCPFSMGRLGSFSGDFVSRSPDRFPTMKKNSVDITNSCTFNEKSNSSRCKNAGTTFTTPPISTMPQSTSGIDHKCGNNLNNITLTASSCPLSTSCLTCSVSNPERTEISSSGQSHGSYSNNVFSSLELSREIDTSIPDPSPRAKSADTSPPPSADHVNKESSVNRSSDPESVFLFQENNQDNDSAAAISIRPVSVATANKYDLSFSPHNNNDGGRLNETNASSGNGNTKHKKQQIHENSDKKPTDKKDSKVNGTHGNKNEHGCMAGTKFQKTKLPKKSKACEII